MAVETHQLLRHQRVEVDGWFEVHDHCVDLNLTDRVTLLHGQIGTGKMSVLPMISALLGDPITYLRQDTLVPFESP